MHTPIIESCQDIGVEDDAGYDSAVFYAAYLLLMVGAGGAMLLASSFIAFGR